ncbi:cytochrome-c oxidase, cbb3-type subunit III [Paenochrobactrum sp. BZR 588]|uniref:cytochrome-c oxidase, cbb3-type subunit III n=1 Tax=unclassified Paenochrobactrum TaxID=2639760 RepID=UPI003853F107
MAIKKLDPVTGQQTTGHEWNGIEELDNPVPRVVKFFLIVTTLFGIVYWVLMPAWPLGVTYTKGLLGIDQRDTVAKKVQAAAVSRAVWMDQIAEKEIGDISGDPELMAHVKATGSTLFADNCSVCHGTGGTGGAGFPALTTSSWLWGGEPDEIAETIRVGINSAHPDTRMSQMMGFGQEEVLLRSEILEVVAYVRSLSGLEMNAQEAAKINAGQKIFADNCSACHGDEGQGSTDVGAPDLSDKHWIYGGDLQSVYTSVYYGRQGQMPSWEGRFSPAEIKLLTAYVLSLGSQTP